MKRISRILILLLVMFIPFAVKADVGMPERSEYEVIVTKTDGIKNYYGENKPKIPYNTIIKIYYESTKDGELYLHAYEENEIIVKSTDVELYGDKLIEGKSFGPESIPTTYYAYEDGAYLYKGPSMMYGKVSEEPIKKGSKLKQIGYGSDDCFSYVEYNGQKGWIYTYDFYAAEIYNEPTKFASLYEGGLEYIMINPKLKLYKDVNSDEYEEINVKVGDTYTFDMSVHTRNNSYYGKFINGEVKWVRAYEKTTLANGDEQWDSLLFSEWSETLIMKEDVPYYSDSKCTKQAGTLKAFEKVETFANGIESELIYDTNIMFKKDNNYYFLKSDWENHVPAFRSITKDCKYLIVLDKTGMPYFSDAKLKNQAGKLKNGSMAKIIGYDEDKYYLIEVDGKQYIVYIGTSGFDKNLITNEYDYKYKTFYKDIEIFTDIQNVDELGVKGLKESMIIPKGEIVLHVALKYEDGQYYNLVRYNDTFGFIKEYNSNDVERYSDPTVCPFDGSEMNLKKDPKEEPKEEPKKDKKIDTSTIIIICVIVGVALAITAVVVIILVNKKKNAVPTEEVKPVEPETVMTENDLNLVKEKVEEEPKEEVTEETPEPENKEDNGEE